MYSKRDEIAQHRHVSFTCGWTSRELALQAEDARIRNRGGDIGMNISAWIGQQVRKENAVQTLPEDSSSRYIRELKRPAPVNASLDGLLHQGDVVQLLWSGGPWRMLLSALPAAVGEGGLYEQPCRATGIPHSGTLLRSSVRVFRNDSRISSSVPLMHDECIFLCTLEPTGTLFLSSEPRTYSSFAPLSEHQEVTWVKGSSSRNLWKAVPIEGRSSISRYIQVNEDLALNHVNTNQNLALERQYKISTVFGVECEVTAHTGASKNSRTTGSENQWQFFVPYHGSVMPVHRSDRRPPTCRTDGRFRGPLHLEDVENRRNDIAGRFDDLLHPA